MSEKSKPKTTDEKKAGAKAAAGRKAPGSPFVGRTLSLALAPGNDPLPACRCVGQSDGFLRVVANTSGQAAWINLDHVMTIVVLDDDPAAPADDSPEALAASLEAAGSPYGPVTVKVAGGPQKAG